MYVIVQRYANYYSSIGRMPSSSEQAAEKIDRMITLLVDKHNVVIEPKKIHGLDGSVLHDFYTEMASGRKMATINNYVCFLNPFLRWAYDEGAIPEDLSGVLRTHRLPSEDTIPEWERKEKYMTPEQVRELLTVMPGRNKIRDRAIIALFLGTGLRVSELCSLTLSSILDQPHGKLYCCRKGGAWKHVLVADYVYPYLEAYLKTRNDMSERGNPLFVTTHGNAANRNQIYKAIAFKQKALNLSTGPHNFRHTFVSEAEKIGGAGIARDLANHRSIRTTNRYDHSTQEQRANAINSLPWGTQT